MHIINLADDFISKAKATAERAELEGARNGDLMDASRLLLSYAEDGHLDAPDVQAAIENGVRQVLKRIVETATTPDKRRLQCDPLMFFDEEFKTKSRSAGRRSLSEESKKSTAAILKLRAVYNAGLTEEDMQYALTSIYSGLRVDDIKDKAGNLPRENWPLTIGEAEEKLTTYVEHLFTATTPEARIEYVRRCFPNIEWDSPASDFPYPKHWYLRRN